MPTVLTDAEVDQYTVKLAGVIGEDRLKYHSIYPVPMGGYPVAVALGNMLRIPVACYFYPDKNQLIVDDLIDSGRTLARYPNKDKAVLIVKNDKESEITYYAEKAEGWIVFPWEKENDIRETIVRQLEFVGEDPSREGLLETPDRVVKSWEKLFGGYKRDPKKIIKTFDKESYDEMILLRDIEFYSTCEHHLLPFFGKAHIAYIPDKKVIGISKLARLLEIYSRRLQIQERLAEQITDFLMTELKAIGAGCILKAQHFCMTSRGIEKQHSVMVTSSLKGALREKQEARAEFLQLCEK